MTSNTLFTLLNEQTPQDHATPRYDIFSDSIVYSDELPPPDLLDIESKSIFQKLLKARTAVVLGESSGLGRNYSQFQVHCPRWAGWSSERWTSDGGVDIELSRHEAITNIDQLADPLS